MTIIVSLLLFISVIVLTHDYFDSIEGKDTILVTLLICQLGIIVYTQTYRKTKKRSR